MSGRLARLLRERDELLARFANGRARLTGAAVIKSGGASNDDALRLRWLNQQIEGERARGCAR